MKWSEKTWLLAEPIYNKIVKLPFIKELINGQLEKDKFIFYIRQDAIYLADYGRILAGITSKLSKSEHITAFTNFASESVLVEKALHESFIKDLNKEDTHPSPSGLLYASFLWKQLACAPVEVALAAVLPCFWIYKKVGDYILLNQTKGENPYQNWINTYGGEDFEKSTSLAISICDEFAEESTVAQQEAMSEAFIMCSKFEWMFWDSAYRKEEWTI